MTSRKIAELAVFVALVVALGYALAGVPNVELMTLATFVSGTTLGSRSGAFVGAAAMGIYSSLNPYGLAPPPVFAAQVIGMGITGLAGGAARGHGGEGRGARLLASIPLGGVIGAGLALLYDALTNLGTAWSIGMLRDPWPVVAGGIAFGAWHVAWNAVVFAVAAPALIAALRRRVEEAP
jgi:hypothetical protein